MATIDVMAEAQIIRVTDGKIHLRYLIDGRKIKDERCNLGQVEVEVLSDEQFTEVDPSALCDYCFRDRSSE